MLNRSPLICKTRPLARRMRHVGFTLHHTVLGVAQNRSVSMIDGGNTAAGGQKGTNLTFLSLALVHMGSFLTFARIPAVRLVEPATDS